MCSPHLSFHFFNPGRLNAIRSIRGHKRINSTNTRASRNKIDTCNFVCVRNIFLFPTPKSIFDCQCYFFCILFLFILSDRIFFPVFQTHSFILMQSSPSKRLSNRNSHQHNKQCNQIVIEMKSVCVYIFFSVCLPQFRNYHTIYLFILFERKREREREMHHFPNDNRKCATATAMMTLGVVAHLLKWKLHRSHH